MSDRDKKPDEDDEIVLEAAKRAAQIVRGADLTKLNTTIKGLEEKVAEKKRAAEKRAEKK